MALIDRPVRGRRKPGRRVLLVRGAAVLLACVLAVVGCAAEDPAPHPLGAACTWPAGVDPQRDGFAVLASYRAPAHELVLLDVASGGVRARCRGVIYTSPEASLRDGLPFDPVPTNGSVLLSPASPDWRFVVASVGIVELATGVVVAPPVPGWTAVALPGGGRVLRVRAGPLGVKGREDSGNWCVAPRWDAPPQECPSVPGDGPGVPVVHGDGTVGWARAVGVPVQLDGRTGVVQTDGTRIVQLRLDRLSGDDTAVVDASGRAGLIGRDDFRFARGNKEVYGQPGWYTLDRLDRNGASGRLHVGADSWKRVEAVAGSLPNANGAAVIDGGRAVVVSLPGSNGRDTATIMRLAEDGPATALARLKVGSAPDAQIAGWPVILSWPDSMTSVRS